jgi:hypothetical protein
MRCPPYVTTLGVNIGPVGMELSADANRRLTEIDITIEFEDNAYSGWLIANIYADVATKRDDGNWRPDPVKLDGRFYAAVKTHLMDHHTDRINEHMRCHRHTRAA